MTAQERLVDFNALGRPGEGISIDRVRAVLRKVESRLTAIRREVKNLKRAEAKCIATGELSAYEQCKIYLKELLGE